MIINCFCYSLIILCRAALSSQLLSQLPQIQRGFKLNFFWVTQEFLASTTEQDSMWNTSPHTPQRAQTTQNVIFLRAHTHVLVWGPWAASLKTQWNMHANGGNLENEPILLRPWPTFTELREDRASVLCGIQEALDVSLNRKWADTTWQFATLKHVNFLPQRLLVPT